MKTTEQKVPALRFPEFEGEWEEKKLGEVLTIFNGYAFSSSDATTNGTSWVKIANVGIQEMRNDDLSYLPSTFKEDYSKFLLKEGDYIIALTRPILNGKLKVAEVSAFFNNSLLNQRVGKIVSNESQPFIYCLLQLNKVIHEIENNIAGTDPPNLSPKDIDSIKFSFPSLPEQQKIADFLSATDKRLELLKEKKQGLEDYKRGAMQGIFSQELRFTRADGSAYEDWEEKKLGEVCEVMRGTSFSKSEMVEEGEMKCIHYGELFTEYKEVISFISSRTNITKGVFSHKGDVLMPTSDVTPNGLARASALSIENVLLGGDMNIIRIQKRLLSVFLSYFLNFDKQNIIRLVTGTTVKHIYASDIKSLDIPLPSLSEQAQIANFLSAIDVKIEKLSEQIEATENYKKGLLQQMFV